MILRAVLSFLLLLILITNACSPKHPALLLQEPPTAFSQDDPILVLDPNGHSAMIRDVMFTPDGKSLISVSNDKTIHLWDVETGDLIKTIRGQIGDGSEGKLYAGALAPDGKTLAVGGYPSAWGIRLFNIQSSEQIGLLKGHSNTIYTLAFSSDGKWLASGSGDNTVRVWDVSSQKEIAKLKGHTDGIYGVVFSPDGKKLISVANDDIGILWNWRNKKIINKLKKHTDMVPAVAFAPDGQYIITGGADGKILLWDGEGNFIKEVDTYSDDVVTVSFSADSKKIVISGTGNFDAIVYSIPSGKQLSSFSKHNNTVIASAFYGNELIATAGGENNDIYIWDANSGAVKTHILGKGRRVWAVAFGEGLNVAFGNKVKSGWVVNDYGILEKSFNFSTMTLNPQTPNGKAFPRIRIEYLGKKIKRIDKWTLKVDHNEIKQDTDSDQGIRCYTFTQDGNIVVGSQWSLKLYSNQGSFIREFTGHTGEVWAVSTDQSGRILASASSDQTIKLWNLQSGELLVTLFVTHDNEWICWTPKGYYAASAGGEKYIGWQINQGLDKTAEYYPAYTFRKKFHNKELVSRTIEWASFDKAFAEYNSRPGKHIVQEKLPQLLPPDISWQYPDDYYKKTSSKTIRIRANISSKEKITALKIQVNGGTVATTSKITSIPGKGQFDKIIEFDVPLTPKENKIRIYAENTNAFSTSKERVVFYESQDWKKPNLYMVSIGISKYSRSEQNLSFADKDAREMSRIFSSQQGKLFRKVSVKPLYNEQATRAKIIKALQWLEENTTQKDVAVLFVAAHGYNEREDYYILPHDGDPDNLMLTGVDKSLFERTLGNLPSRVLLFLDTCHGGQLGTDLFAERGRIDNTEALRELASPEYGMIIMSASTAAEPSLERAEWGHGAFTKALIEGLEQGRADQTGDKIIHINELDHFLSERVKGLTKGKQHATTQKPSSISRFPIFQLK
jgi:WD40 repeat protein